MYFLSKLRFSPLGHRRSLPNFAILFRSFGFIAPKTLSCYLDFQSLDFEHIYLMKVIPQNFISTFSLGLWFSSVHCTCGVFCKGLFCRFVVGDRDFVRILSLGLSGARCFWVKKFENWKKKTTIYLIFFRKQIGSLNGDDESSDETTNTTWKVDKWRDGIN